MPGQRQKGVQRHHWSNIYCARRWLSKTPSSLSELSELPAMSRSKFKNKKVELDGYVFDSQAEAKHYKHTLLPRLEAGDITHFEVHPRIRCEINGRKICDYLADFRYFDRAASGPDGQVGCQVVEDVKGFKTDIYRLKKKLVEALYPGTKICEISPQQYRSKTL